MMIATWNVNSLKVRLPQLLSWLEAKKPAIVCLQETKCPDEAFPAAALQEAGYHAAFIGQKTYNGVAILSREVMTAIHTNPPFLNEVGKRVIAATVQDLRIVSVYAPNGQSLDSEKYLYKLEWYKYFTDWIKTELERFPSLVLAGDFNIAPDDRDVYDPKAWAGQVLVSDKEREAFQRLINIGVHDALRLLTDEGGIYTWWDYRQGAFWRNWGLRIDHILVSDTLKTKVQTIEVDRKARGAKKTSDHAPLMLALKD